jgi:hypothetical protein
VKLRRKSNIQQEISTEEKNVLRHNQLDPPTHRFQGDRNCFGLVMVLNLNIFASFRGGCRVENIYIAIYFNFFLFEIINRQDLVSSQIDFHSRADTLLDSH